MQTQHFKCDPRRISRIKMAFSYSRRIWWATHPPHCEKNEMDIRQTPLSPASSPHQNISRLRRYPRRRSRRRWCRQRSSSQSRRTAARWTRSQSQHSPKARSRKTWLLWRESHWESQFVSEFPTYFRWRFAVSRGCIPFQFIFRFYPRVVGKVLMKHFENQFTSWYISGWPFQVKKREFVISCV